MYLPRHFAVDDVDLVVDALRTAGAGELVTVSGGRLFGTTMPFVVDVVDGGIVRVRGHLARANRQWRDSDPAVDALLVVRGPDGYVSPSAYPSKRVDGRVVPTWNYVTIHVGGRFVAHDDPAWTEQLVRELTSRHEASRDEPWSVDDAPRDFVEQMLRAIVGVSIEVSSVEAKFKLSQNRADADRSGVGDDLGRGNDRQRALAAVMAAAERRRSTAG